MRRAIWQWLLISSLGAVMTVHGSGVGAAEDHRQQGAHVHGLGHLDVAIEGARLQLELSSPAGDLVGFEHRPVTDAERAALDEAVARLREGERLFRLPADSGCRLKAVELASPLLGLAESSTEVDHGHGHEHDQPHADLHASYRFRCDRPAALNEIEVALFAAFPAIQRLEVQIVTEHAQRAAELTAASPVLAL